MKVRTPTDPQFNILERLVLALLNRLGIKWKTMIGTGSAFFASIALYLRDQGVEWVPPWLPFTLAGIASVLVPVGLAHKIQRDSYRSPN